MNSTGMAPTIYEIAEHFKIKTSTVFAHIRALQKKAYLTRSSKARSIALNRPKKKSKMPANVQSVPVKDPVAVNAPAAQPQQVLCDSKVFQKAAHDKDLFAMHVRGSDLQGLGILDGDIVIVKSNPNSVNSGDIVLTVLNGQEVFQICHPIDQETVELSNSDGKHKTTGKKSDLPLKGVVIGLQRSL